MTFKRISVMLVGLGAIPAFSAQNVSSALPAAEIVRRSVAVNTADWKAQPEYDHKALDLKSKVDSSGNSQGQTSKSFEVMMIDGSPYNRLIAIENEPLTPAQAAQEEDKMRREMLRRQHESSGDRHARLSKYQSDRDEEHFLMQQMVDAFEFKLAGEETVEGAECYVLDASPRPGYVPSVERARVLTGMRGRLWIDKAQYHWVKVQAEVTSPVSFGFFIAQVKPGTKFELDQAPVGGVWLPKAFSESVNASVLGLYGYRTKEETYYSDYHLNQLSAGTRVAAP